MAKPNALPRPQVAIALATYNGERFLETLLNTLLEQSHACQIYVRDDNSSDSTPLILERYAQAHTAIKILDNFGENRGPKDNFATLLSESLLYEWDYLCFADQDDIWHPKKVERLLKVTSSSKTHELIYGDLRIVDAESVAIHVSFMSCEGFKPENQTLERQLIENISPGCSMMLSRALAEACSPVPQDAIMHDWWCALVAQSIGTTRYIPEALIDYRQHENNAVGASRWNLAIMLKKLTDKKLIESYFNQARALEKRLSNDPSNESSLATIKGFLATEQMSRLNRSLQWIKLGHHKTGVIHNLGVHALSLLKARKKETEKTAERPL